MNRQLAPYVVVFALALAGALLLKFYGQQPADNITSAIGSSPPYAENAPGMKPAAMNPSAARPVKQAVESDRSEERTGQTGTRQVANTGDRDQRADSSPSPTRSPPTLPQGRYIVSGRVLTRDGSPVPEMVVKARATELIVDGQRRPVPRGVRPLEAKSGHDGRFNFENLPGGEFMLSTDATDRFSGATIRVQAGAESANLVVSSLREARIEGTITSNFGEPIRGVTVSANVEGAKPVVSDQYGRYVLDANLPVSTKVAILRASHPGFEDREVRVETEQSTYGGSFEMDIVLQPISDTTLVDVKGTVRGPDREPVAGQRLRMGSAKLRENYRAITDEDGKYVFYGVEPGDDYALLISATGGYQDMIRRDIDVPKAGLELDIDLEKQETGTLSGRIVDVHGNPVPGYSLMVKAESASFDNLQIASDVSGNFRTEQAPAGRLVLKRETAPFYTIDGIELQPDSEKNIAVVIDHGSNRIIGRVTDKDGYPVATPSITLTWSHMESGIRSQSRRTASSDEYGNFTFTELGPGPHVLIVNAEGYHPYRVTHDVATQGSDLVVELVKR